MTVPSRCPSCGTPSKPGDAFCGACGADLSSLQAAAPQPSPLRTMLGLPGQMGFTPPAAPAPTPPEPANKVPPAQRTVLGMMAPEVPGMAPAPPARAPEAGKATGSRTVMGVAPPLAKEPAAGIQPKKTMVGMAAPQAPGSGPLLTVPRASLPPPQPGGAKISPQSDRTMLGMPAAPSQRPQADTARPSDTGSSMSDSMGDIPGARSSRGLRVVLAVVAGALLLLGVGLAGWHFTSGTPLSVRVVNGEQGETLEVEVPAAEPGVKVRFLDAEHELHAGKASFPLSADSLALGDNELKVGIVRGNGTETHAVKLHVAYRARADLGGVSADPPTLVVAIDALPGSQVTLDGEALKLDAKGHGEKPYPLKPDASNKLAFSAKYHITPKGGAAADGALQLSLPVTSLQIDRPGESVTTDQSSIEVAGAVEGGAEVSVDGAKLKLNEGRFLQRVKLPKLGASKLHVVASAKGKVARSLDIEVQRVADLAQAAAGFKADSSLNYARIAQNPVIYRGQNVAIEGRVYNVEVKAGASHLQMLARDCPSQRCPLWVELPQATDVTVDSWVRVLGSVAGEQQFRSEKNQVHTVPSVRAHYVLKLPR